VDSLRPSTLVLLYFLLQNGIFHPTIHILSFIFYSSAPTFL
jgi:hypothetical protein